MPFSGILYGNKRRYHGKGDKAVGHNADTASESSMYRSYLAAFHFLDYYYFHINYPENKAGLLGGMLGAMSPDNGVISGIPDIAYYSKWVEITGDDFRGDGCLECFERYARFYINEYDFDFLLPVLEYLESDVGKRKFEEIERDIMA